MDSGEEASVCVETSMTHGSELGPVSLAPAGLALSWVP